jgi:NADH-quinone oxidoreductase subunit G
LPNHYELPVLNQQVIADLPESTVRELEQNPPSASALNG